MPKQKKFPRRENEPRATTAHFCSRQVHFDIPERQPPLPNPGAVRAAPQQGFDARDQFAHIEWLGDVVVRSQLQADNLVDGFAPRREYKDRSCIVPLTQLAAYIEATNAWQLHVKQNQIMAVLFR